MSLQAINTYVNDLITANRDLDPENISLYFQLMSEEAAHLLDQLNRAKMLKGLEGVSSKLLFDSEKKVIREVVDYILVHSDNLALDLKMLEVSGLLNLEEALPGNRYHIRYNLETVLQRAGRLYFDQLGWWKSFIHRRRPTEHFVKLFELAVTDNSSNKQSMANVDSELTDGMYTAR